VKGGDKRKQENKPPRVFTKKNKSVVPLPMTRRLEDGLKERE
jgi:hypothetical protein